MPKPGNPSRVSQVVATVSESADMTNANTCGQLPALDNSISEPHTISCGGQGAVGRHIKLAKPTTYLDIDEVNIVVKDLGESS